MDGPREGARRDLFESLREKLGGLPQVERLERQLRELTAAPEVVPEAAKHVVARKPVRTVGRHHEQRQACERLGERDEEVECGLVRPLEVVEHDQMRLPRDVFEGAERGLEQRRTIGHRRGRAELGQDEREVRPQGAAVVEASRIRAEVGAERRDDRPVGRPAAVARTPPQRGSLRASRQLLGQARLSHARLAGHQHQRARAESGALQRIGEALAFRLPPDELDRSGHRLSLGPAGGPSRPPAGGRG